MQMALPLHIALRFLFKSVRARPLNLFTLISLFGISFSVLLFLFIDTLVTGLSVQMRETLIGFEAPLSLEVAHGFVPEVRKQLEMFADEHKTVGLKTTHAQIFDGLVQILDQPPTGAKVRSVDKNFFTIKRGKLEVYWLEGYDEGEFVESGEQILIGEQLFERLHFVPGLEAKITVTHPFADIGPSGEIEPAQKEFAVAGLFSTGRVDFDDVYVLLPEGGMQALTSGIMVKNKFYVFPDHLEGADGIKNSWNLSPGHAVLPMQTWFDRNQNAFKAMRLEKLMYFIIFVFVLSISCFNLMGVISIFEFSKSHDAAVLKSLGLSRSALRAVYMNLGFILGGGGMICGLGVGLLVISILKMSHVSLPSAYGFTDLPLAVNLMTVLFLMIGTPFMAALISYFPTLRLSRRSLVEVLCRS